MNSNENNIKEVVSLSLKDLFIEIEDKMKSYLENNKFPRKSINIPDNIYYELDTQHIHDIEVVDWTKLKNTVFGEKLENLNCKSKLETLFEVKDDTVYIDYFVGTLFVDVLEKYSYEDMKIQSSLIEDYVDKIMNWLEKDDNILQLEIALAGIQVKEKIFFNNGWLEPITEEKRVQLFLDCKENEFSSDNPSESEIGYCTTLLVLKEEKKRSSDDFFNRDELRKLAEQAITLLRIYDYGPVVESWETRFSKNFVTRWSGRGRGKFHSFIDKHRTYYKVSDTNGLANFLNENIGFDFNKRNLKYIVTRLTDSCLRNRAPEYLIFDYISILEAVFLGKDQGELSFRVSLYNAAFNGQDSEERNNIYSYTRKAYDLRSKIAHCAKYEEKHVLSDVEKKVLFKAIHNSIKQVMKLGLDEVRTRAFDKLLL